MWNLFFKKAWFLPNIYSMRIHAKKTNYQAAANMDTELVDIFIMFSHDENVYW